jgi:hypothetical protein
MDYQVERKKTQIAAGTSEKEAEIGLVTIAPPRRIKQIFGTFHLAAVHSSHVIFIPHFLLVASQY